MTPELQSQLIKWIGALVQAAIAIACIKLIPNEKEMIAAILSSTAAAYGVFAFNTPIKAVQEAKGLVSLRAPNVDDTNKMRAAVMRADSMKPPPAGVIP